jgi:hypothetical protein
MHKTEINPGGGTVVPGNLPARVCRRMAAQIVTRIFFPVSHRTLERWPVTWRRINGRALVDTSELLAEAQRRLDEATAIIGGHR